MLKLLFRSRKVQRLFGKFFRWHEVRLSRLNLAANVPAERPSVSWRRSEELSDVVRFFAFHDRHCPDVRSIVTPTWLLSHFRGRYPHHVRSDETLEYSVESAGEGAWRFRSGDEPGTWIFLSSREVLPPAYAIEFDYTPLTVFKEQLQIDFGATSLAERHRLILTYNEFVRYQRIECGFCLEDVAHHPLSLPLGKPTRFRLEVVGNAFALLAGGRLVASWRDRRYRPRPARAFLLFWNGPDRQAMDFILSAFTVETAIRT